MVVPRTIRLGSVILVVSATGAQNKPAADKAPARGTNAASGK
jgi:hypothetical protein